MKLLAVDTTAKAASVCLASEDGIIGEFYVNTALTHSQTLMPMLEQLLSSTGTKISDLDAIAVNAGPGSFTGVRIGVAAVKGLAFADDLPCIPVSTVRRWTRAAHRSITPCSASKAKRLSGCATTGRLR